MHRLFNLLFLLLLPIGVFAQVGYPTANPEELVQRVFTAEFVKANKLKVVEVEYAFKLENERITKPGRKFLFYYDANGLMTWHAEIPVTGSRDSILTFYYKNADSTLLIRRKAEQGRFNSRYMTLDKEGRIIRNVTCTETSLGESFRFFKPDNQYVTALETIEYIQQTPEQLRKKFYNDNGALYKEGIAYFKDKRLESEELKFTATGIRANSYFKYDEKGRITEYIYYTDAIGEYTEGVSYSYENDGLNSEKYFRNTIPVVERFFYYQKESPLMESVLTKKTTDFKIEFFNFNYQFYP
jgi:hypothetical protein